MKASRTVRVLLDDEEGRGGIALSPQLARKRPIVRLADGRVAVLVFWPPTGDYRRAARVMLGGARSVPVLPADVVEVLAS